MREFKTVCIDNETQNEMVLSECSYNTACYWLMSKGFEEPERLENRSGKYYIYYVTPREITFIYDEDRGYLLREV